MVEGDIYTQVVGNQVGVRWLVECMDEFRLDSIIPLGDAWTNGYDQPIYIKVTVWVHGDGIAVDFAGTSPQSPYGINVVLNQAPEGCILNARWPAPVAGRHVLGHFVPGAVFKALQGVIPSMADGAAAAPRLRRRRPLAWRPGVPDGPGLPFRRALAGLDPVRPDPVSGGGLRRRRPGRPGGGDLLDGPGRLAEGDDDAAAGAWHWYRGPLAARLPEEALALSAQAKDYRLTPADVAAYAAAHGDARLTDLAEAYARFQAALAQEQAATFSDFIDRAVARLERDPKVAQGWQQRFDHILVDEFQDTNPAQFRVLQILSHNHQNLMVVGDDDQAIYRFRGATDRFILNFGDHFPAAATYPVEENFCCPAPVLAVGPLRAGGGGGTRWPPRPWPCCG